MTEPLVSAESILRLFPGIPYRVEQPCGGFGPVQNSPNSAQPREPDELAHAIAAATDRDLHDVDMWLTALREDVAYNDPQMKQLLLLAMNGEDMQFGVRLAQAIRRQVIHNATEETRDEWEEAHGQ